MFCSFAKHNLFTLKSLDIKVFVSVVGFDCYFHTLFKGRVGHACATIGDDLVIAGEPLIYKKNSTVNCEGGYGDDGSTLASTTIINIITRFIDNTTIIIIDTSQATLPFYTFTEYFSPGRKERGVP